MSFMGGGMGIAAGSPAGDGGGIMSGLAPGAGPLDGLFGKDVGVAGIAGAALKIVGPLLGAFGQQSAAGQNAEMSRLMADSVRKEAEEKAQMRLRESARIASQGKANFAKAGVEVDAGTPLLVELASREAGEADARAIRETGAAKGRYYDAQAKQSKTQGSNAMMSGLIDAGSGFLSSGAGKGLLS